jgi:hypothetical protein
VAHHLERPVFLTTLHTTPACDAPRVRMAAVLVVKGDGAIGFDPPGWFG